MMLAATAAAEEAVNGYPAALATHDEVVNQPGLFLDTLKAFHSMVGTKYSVPVIAKKELDLHMLYVEVTKRGGYDKVVNEKKWREIGFIFDFAPTTTSASYVLKKHYNTLLYHYEKVYFFNSGGPPHPAFASQAHLPPGKYVCGPDEADSEEYTPNCSGYPSDSPARGSFGFPVVGTIDGKFDCGYLVSVKLGSEILYGVLYHPEKKHPPVSSSSETHKLSTAIVPYDPKPHRRGRRRRKKRRWGDDPTHPKPNRSGYNFFFAEQHSKLKSLYPNIREFTKMVGESWNNLSPEEKMVYNDIGLRDKERYRRELDVYREKLRERREMVVASSQAGH